MFPGNGICGASPAASASACCTGSTWAATVSHTARRITSGCTACAAPTASASSPARCCRPETTTTSTPPARAAPSAGTPSAMGRRCSCKVSCLFYKTSIIRRRTTELEHSTELGQPCGDYAVPRFLKQ